MQRKVYHATDHDIDPQMIDRDALYVINRLKEAGFKAYLVGGSVRDLLAKKTPKDFDISTSARPEEVKAVFGRQCLLIGRRFRLAHIRFGRKVIEVATFRAGDPQEGELITQDNVWGTEEEDVLRRDFTINGLFLDPTDHTVIDYVGGWDDIHTKTLRTIGDAEVRFKQDPVRMIRLIKFRARFRFEIISDAKKALLKCRSEISKSSPARVLEELFRMLESGYSAPFFQLMVDSKMLELLFPHLTLAFKGHLAPKIYNLLLAADELNQGSIKRPLDRALLMSCLIFPIIEEKLHTEFTQKGITPHLGHISQVIYDTLRDLVVSSFSHFPRRIMAISSQAMMNQFRLTPINQRKHHPPRLFRNRDFPEALLFLKLRALADESLQPFYKEWREQYQHFVHQNEKKPHKEKLHAPHPQ